MNTRARQRWHVALFCSALAFVSPSFAASQPATNISQRPALAPLPPITQAQRDTMSRSLVTVQTVKRGGMLNASDEPLFMQIEQRAAQEVAASSSRDREGRP